MVRLGKWLSRKGSASASNSTVPAEAAMRPSGMLALERRIAFDAAVVETIQRTVGPVEAADPAAVHDVIAVDTGYAPVSDKGSAGPENQPTTVPTMDARPSNADGRTEIIFIDGRVADVATLIRGLNNPGAEVVLLDANRDGVQQIADALAGRTGIDAIHILSHGSEADLLLGTSHLTASTINGQYETLLTRIGQSLSTEADILIYGCDFGKGADGKLAAELLAAKTGADVAASIDPTGNADRGGDWDLERIVGDVDTTLELSIKDWEGLLAAVTVNPTGGALASGADGLRILVTDLGQMQVYYQNQNQFYQSSVVTDNSINLYNGIYLAVGTQVIGPDTGAENITKVSWKAVGPQLLTGTGTATDPFVVTTTMYFDQDANSIYDPVTDTKMEVKTVYVSTNKYITQNVTVTPSSTNTSIIKFYHGIDTFLAGGDNGPAFSLKPDLAINNNLTGDSSFVGVRKAVGTATESLVGFAEVDGGAQFSNYYSATWNAILNGIANGGDIVNTWNTNPNTDNGIGVQFTLGAITAPTTFSYQIAFDGDTKLDLDANNSTTSGTSYAGIFTASTGSQISVVDSDVSITNVIGDINYARVTLTSPQAGDVLTVDSAALPAGVSVEAVTASSVSFSGIASEAAYQNVLQLVKFSTTSGTTSTRTFTVEVRNQLNSITSTATSTLTGALSPTVDLNSGLTAVVYTNNTVNNPGFSDYADVPVGWTEGGTGAATNTSTMGRYGFTNTSADTLTQTGLTRLNTGPAPSGAGRLTLDIGYVHGDNNARTFNIQVGGVTYATLTTGLASGASGSITYLNGATNAAGTTTATAVTGMASALSALTSITINLPTSVAATGSLVFSASNNADDVYIDNVNILTSTLASLDTTPGNDLNVTFAQNGTAVSIANASTDVRDGDSANMVSGVITLTNAQPGDRLLVGGSTAASGTISGVSYTNTGTLITLTGSATKATYASIIRAITFEHTIGSAVTGTVRDVTVQLNDGGLNSNLAHSYITVTDAPPVLDLDANDSAATGTGFTATFTENGAAVAIADTDTSVTDTNDTVMESATVSLTNQQTGDRLLVNGSSAASGTLASGIGWTRTDTLVTLTGAFTKVQYAAALQLVQFQNTSEAPSTVDRLISVKVNDGSTDSNIATSTIRVTAVNDAPVVATPVPDQSVNEDTAWSYVVPLGSFTDVDSSLTWSATLDTGAALPSWLSFTAATRTFSGTPPLNFNGTIGLRVTVTDGVASAVSDDFVLTVNPVNDNPVLTGSGSASYTENAVGVVIAPAIVVSDVDNTTFASATVTISNFVSGQDVLAFTNVSATMGNVAITSNASGVLTLTSAGGTATTAQWQAALRSVTYANTSDNPTTTTRNIDFRLNDGQSVNNLSAILTSTVSVTAVNDAPVVATPIPDQSVNEDTAWSYVVPLGSFTDVDSSLTWSATLDTGAALPSWLSFTAVTRTFSGTPPLNFNGTIGLRVTVTDGVATPVSDDFVLTVNPVNDAPINNVPGAQTINEDTSRIFSVANGNAITVSDIDINSGTFTTVVSVPAGEGLLTAVTGGGALISGNGTNSVSITGTKLQVDTALNGLSYAPTANLNGVVTLTVQTSDNGGTGFGGAQTDTDTVTINITAVNDAPVLAVPIPDQVINEDQPFSYIVPVGTFTDIDNASLTWTATLSDNSPLPSWLSFNGLTRIFTGTPPANFNGAIDFKVTGSDGALFVSDIFTLTILPVNDAPDGTDKTATVSEDAVYTFAASDFGLTDTSDTPADTLQSVIITTLPSAGEGVLKLSGIAVTAGQEISLVNLASLTFTPVANLNGTSLGAFTFQVRDTGGTANGGVNLDPVVNNFRFNITPVNDVPVAANDMVTTAEDTAVTFNVRGNDTDIDGDALGVSAINGTAISVGSPVAVTHGTVALLADGRLTFTPAADYNGPASFNYTVRDPSGATSTALVSITVTPINDAPVSPTPIASQSGLDGASVNLDVSGNFTDVDGDAITFSATSLPAGLTINPTTGVISGTIDRNASVAGTYNVVVEAMDPSGASVTRGFTYIVTNPTPTPANDTFTMAEDTDLTGNLLANNGAGLDADPDGDALTVAIMPVTPPAHGTVTINTDGSFTYTPALNYYGADSFVYSVTDANGATATATASITITPVNDAPVPPASIPGQTHNDGQAITPVNLATGWSDIEGNALTFSAIGLPPGLSIAADGTVTGTLTSSASTGDGTNDGVRTYSVTLTATDSDGAVTSRILTWTVNNLPPDARDDVAATGEATAITGLNVITDVGPGRDVDPDGDTSLTVIAVNGLAGGVSGSVTGSAGGLFTINADGSYSFDPGADFIDVPAGGTRATSVQYTISDGQGGTDSAMLTVTVTGINQAPVATVIGDKASLDGAVITTNIAPFFSDIDADTLSFSISAGELPSGLTLNASTGQISGTIDNQASQGGNVPGQPGVYSVTIQVTDTSGATASSTFTWSVSNPAPTAVNDGPLNWVEDSGTLKDIDVLGNDTDPDGDPLVVVSATAAKGTVTINGDGTLNYTPTENYNGTDTIIYQISDGNGGFSTASVTIIVEDDFSDPPILIDPNVLPTLNNQDRDMVSLPVTGFFVRGDFPIVSFTVDGELPPGISFNLATGTLEGALDADASVGAWPHANTPGVYELSIIAIDSKGFSVEQKIRWEVTNPLPTANSDMAVVSEGGTVTIDVLSNDTDPDGGTSNNNTADGDDLVVSAAAAAHGTVTINADGTIHYTPYADFNGTDTITYTLSDGNGGFSTSSVTVTVNPVNDAPEFAPGVTALPTRFHLSSGTGILILRLSRLHRAMS
jgi:Domain of unknown function (DUF4347)/Bacterial Ig domain/Putative Ig domain/Bacterial cadherin-like domain